MLRKIEYTTEQEYKEAITTYEAQGERFILVENIESGNFMTFTDEPLNIEEKQGLELQELKQSQADQDEIIMTMLLGGS